MSMPDPVAESRFYEGVRTRRLAAFVVDLAVILVLLGGVAVIGTLIGILTFGAGFALLVPAFALTGLVYRTTMVMERSATLGMLLMGIELRDARGERLTAFLAFVHAAAYTAILYLPPVLLCSLLYCLFNQRGQLLHDALAGTVMINRPV